MNEELNSIVKQLNRLAQKQTGLNPKAKTIERALKTFVDAYSGGGAGGDSIWGNIIGSIENQTDLIDKIDSMIDDELANFEHLDYEVVDTEPTPATAEEGVRYLYKPAGATAYNEYILIGGTIYNIGSTENVNLTNYYTKAEVDAELNGKADVSDLPTKTSDLTNDSQFVDKDTDQLTNYTKTTALNNALNLKADKSTTYTKTEVNDKLDLKADTDDIPTKTSDLTNDSGFITKAVNNLENYTKTTDLNTALALKANSADIPTKTSDLTNDSGYIDANVNNLTNYTKTTDLNTSLGLKVDKTSVKSTKSTTATDVYSATYLNSTLGDLTNLETDTKTNLVSAINEVNSSISPIGSITMYGGATAPTNWLICDGSAVSRTTYSDLFAVIGTRYGSGDGSGTFNLPDLTGKVPVGLNSADTDFANLGNTGGEKQHKLTLAEMPKHSHSILFGAGTNPEKGLPYPGFVDTSDHYSEFVYPNGGGDPHNILQPYITLNYIIKAKKGS